MNYNEILSNYKKYFNTDLNMLDESYTVIYSSNYINISYKYPVSEIINTTFYCNNDVIIPIWKNYYLSLNKDFNKPEISLLCQFLSDYITSDDLNNNITAFLFELLNSKIDSYKLEDFFKLYNLKNDVARVIDIEFHDKASLFIDKLKSYIIDSKNYFLITHSPLHISIIDYTLDDKIISDIYYLKKKDKIILNIGIGNSYPINLISKSYQEAKEAIFISRTYNLDFTTYYSNLRLEEVVSNLSNAEKERIYSSSYYQKLNNLNLDMLETINTIFSRNLHLTDAAKDLYIHRNTLVYRIDKIKNLIGLDIREFNDAIYLKFLLILKRYENSEQKN